MGQIESGRLGMGQMRGTGRRRKRQRQEERVPVWCFESLKVVGRESQSGAPRADIYGHSIFRHGFHGLHGFLTTN